MWLRDQELHLGLEVMSLATYCSSIPRQYDSAFRFVMQGGRKISAYQAGRSPRQFDWSSFYLPEMKIFVYNPLEILRG